MNEQRFIQDIMAKRDAMINNSDRLYLHQFGEKTIVRSENKTVYGVLLIFSILIILVCATLLSYQRAPVINNEYLTQTFPTTYNNTEVIKRTEIIPPQGQSMICIDNPNTRVRTCYPS